MRLSVISFTERGRMLSEELKRMFEQEWEITLYTKCRVLRTDSRTSFLPSPDQEAVTKFLSILPVETDIKTWAGERMREKSALLFVGACGIAVRAVAPFLTDKLHDVPVLVMDEEGRYCIPILSGHVGGANELARRIAAKTGAEPVITTATDLRGKFAVDLFAKRNGLYIENREGIARVSAKVLAGQEITMSIEPENAEPRRTELSERRSEDGKLLCGTCREAPEACSRITGDPASVEACSRITGDPASAEAGSRITGDPASAGVKLISYPPVGFVDVVIHSEAGAFDASLCLRARPYVIGFGCRKGKGADEIGAFIRKILAAHGILPSQIFALASIEQKRGEPGIAEWCRREGVPFETFTAGELQEAKGNFAESVFVRERMGVGNVCERAAVRACGENGRLIVSKVAGNGMTAAVAERDWKVRFDD